MAALPTSNLKLYDVSMAIGEGNYNISMYNVFTSGSINADGLDPNYCPGATPAARLTNLQTTPYVLGKFRGYDHAAGGSLNSIVANTVNVQNPCNTLSIATTVYSSQTTIALAYGNDQEIYSDSSGTTLANAGWYTEDDTNWYYWDSSSGRWTNYTVCSSGVLKIEATSPWGSQLEACLASGGWDYYYFEPAGSNSTPITGDIVYTDSNLTTFAAPGHYKHIEGIARWEIGKGGVVIDYGKC
jgi:hypothetical protein